MINTFCEIRPREAPVTGAQKTHEKDTDDEVAGRQEGARGVRVRRQRVSGRVLPRTNDHVCSCRRSRGGSGAKNARVPFRPPGHRYVWFSQGSKISPPGSLDMRPDIEWSLNSHRATQNSYGGSWLRRSRPAVATIRRHRAGTVQEQRPGEQTAAPVSCPCLLFPRMIRPAED